MFPTHTTPTVGTLQNLYFLLSLHQYVHVQMCAVAQMCVFFTGVLVLELRSSCLQGKDIAQSATSPALIPVCLFFDILVYVYVCSYIHMYIHIMPIYVYVEYVCACIYVYTHIYWGHFHLQLHSSPSMKLFFLLTISHHISISFF